MEITTDETGINLRHYVEILLRRRWIVASIWLTTVLGAALFSFTRVRVYQGSALLVIEKERGGIRSSNVVMIEAGNEDYYQTQYKLLQSDSLTQKVYDKLGLASSPEFGEPFGLQKLHNAIAIVPVPRSRLFYIKVKSGDPNMAALIANTLAELYVADNVSNQLFISKEVLAALQAKQGDPEARRLYETLPAVVGNALIQSLRAEQVRLETQAAVMGQKYTQRHPAMISLKSNLATVRSQILAETDKVIQSLKIELTGQLQGNNVRVVDRAEVPPIPVYPNRKRMMTQALLAGFLLGYALAFVVEMLDQTIRTQEDVERKLNQAFLGLVPLAAVPAERVRRDLLAPESSLSNESFRSLRTMVDFARVNAKSNAILVTSAVQGEGKTYVSSNLAVTFSQIGETVLLISGDLRRPRLEKNFRVSSQRGLSDFLAKGRQAEELSELLLETDTPNLKVLPCGPPPPNPSELLNTPRLAAAVAWTQAQFDRVIIDCTPIFPISDTLLWGRHVRSSIVVARYGETRVPLVRNACQRLEASNVKVLGVVINAARPGGLSYNYYGYYYQQYYQDYQKGEPAVSAS